MPFGDHFSSTVSNVCDDRSDNVFIHGGNHFPGLDEQVGRRPAEYPAELPDKIIQVVKFYHRAIPLSDFGRLG
ncbi:MAG: hypothetical protein HPZ91_01390 [Lentisphaeria bacterium]|nr:hypothetical protein [Lentisphaeria bacterium]